MAAATLLNPATAYHPHSQPFSSHHQPQAPPPPLMSMVASVESKRPSNDLDAGSRQSLPSLSEVFSGTKPSRYSPTTPTTVPGPQGLPPPFPSVGPPPPLPRSEAGPGPEPRPLPAHEDKFFRYSSRHDSGPIQGPGPGSQTSYSYPDHRDLPKAAEPAPGNGHLNPQPPPPMSYPPGQLPLSAAPPPPARLHGALPAYDPHRAPPPPRAEEDYASHRTRYDATLNRHFEAWGYADCLGKISWNVNTIRNFAESYHKLASEQHGGQIIPERLPTEKEVGEMIDVSIWLKNQLENVRDFVQQSLAEKARDKNRTNGSSYDGDDDISMYSDTVKPTYGEIKKRRGRAAPPGRCHSCNRIDTPEWRRGPDGARTLCNACGLHYAKLERKRQVENRSIRPKAVEERS
ncbi:hypothetical protein F5Y17DRAFT_468936 [Xylariaceae sp. FL0594]|nr:hypothetical protein F5Y17DRAFT_468936 [Xylariaceae sp. FL0594]